jgi:CRP-like cAMP-binding protein
MTNTALLFKSPQVRSYPKGQILLYQGEQSRDIYLIKSGFVKVYDISSKGDEKILLILGPGDIFPLIWSFTGPTSAHYFYETHEECEVAVQSRKEFIDTISERHDLALELLEYFVNRTQELMNRIEAIEATSALHKISQVLLYLAKSNGEKLGVGKYSINPTLTHQNIANLSGLTRETTSLQLKELEEKGVVQNGQDSLVVFAKKLEKLLESPEN